MTANLSILAGKTAYQHIVNNGLEPKDIAAVFGASGAAKWLSIYGLDAAIFGRWLPQSKQPVSLLGTSVGAFKLAAAMQPDPELSLKIFADAYIAQRYRKKPTPKEVVEQIDSLLAPIFGVASDTGMSAGEESAEGVNAILSHERYFYHCTAVHCLGALASDQKLQQSFGVFKAGTSALVSRKRLNEHVKRVLFKRADGRWIENPGIVNQADQIETVSIELTKGNLRQAILASGSLPVYMYGVKFGIPEELSFPYEFDRSNGYMMLRDGGLLDYHPSPSNLMSSKKQLVLYPHFYPYLIEGWFDKLKRKKYVSSDKLDNLIIVTPSDSYIKRLPQKRIPDRKDFEVYAGNDELRMSLWRVAADRSHELGETWLQLAKSGDWQKVLKPLS